MSFNISDGPNPRDSKTKKVYGEIGRSVKLECAAKSVPNSQFVWHHNGYQVYENVETFNDLSRLTVSSMNLFEFIYVASNLFLTGRTYVKGFVSKLHMPGIQQSWTTEPGFHY